MRGNVLLMDIESVGGKLNKVKCIVIVRWMMNLFS